MTRRLSICFAAPGHTLLGTAGSTRNILATAEALSEWADVTVAFRHVAEAPGAVPYRVESIVDARDAVAVRDDVAARGLNPLSHLAYMRVLRDYAARSAPGFDVVLEKGWRLSGYLAGQFQRHGVRSLLIENDARIWNEPVRSVRAGAKFLAHCAAQWVAGRCSRRVPAIAAETEELKEALVENRGIAAERVRVVPLGVDHAIFRVQEQREARDRLGLDHDAVIALYVGGMDQYHDLSPLLAALRERAPERLQVHLVGDGEYRGRYEALAAGIGTPVRFHGQVPHARVPDFIAASDVCLAPYQVRGFRNRQVAFSTLKIPEYMACGRPVISVPSGNILRLIADGDTGFLFDNEEADWREFLTRFPPRERLAAMGRAAAPAVAGMSWRATARRYLDLIGER